MMMPFFLLAIGVSLSAAATALWNANRMTEATGGARMVHALVVGLLIALLAMLGLGAPEPLVRVLALFLCAASFMLCFFDGLQQRLVSFVQIAFGALIASGLPYALA